MNLRDHLEAASRKLEHNGGAGGVARLEAEILLAHALGAPRSFLYAHGELELPRERRSRFQSLVKRRQRGEPIAYLTGRREFWSLSLRITPDVLIPRPETELLVETALDLLPTGRPTRVADIGTGCGAIALAIAKECPEAKVHGTDISAAAIELASRNAHALHLLNVSFETGSWCQPLTGSFDLIVSNPPYVAMGDPHLLVGDCRFEPAIALSPGPDQMQAFAAISREAIGNLAPGGWLLFEHGEDQGEAVRELLAGLGYRDVGTRHDLEGRERVSLGCRSSVRPRA